MDRFRTTASAIRPWNRELPWYIVGIEGAAVLAIGIFLVAAPDTAASTIRWLLGILLLGVSVADILKGFRASRDPLGSDMMAPYLLVRGGAGLMLAIVFLVATLAGYMSDADARYLLGFGMIGYAIIGLAGSAESLSKGERTWHGIPGSLLFLVIGAVLVYNGRNAASQNEQIQLVGWAAVIGGILVLGYTYILWRQAGLVAVQEFIPAQDGAGSFAAPPGDMLAADTDQVDLARDLEGDVTVQGEPEVDAATNDQQ